jgi:hypothetical protein
MKTTVRTFALVLAISGAVAGVASSRTAQPQQVATMSHQVIVSAMPAPVCSPSNCGIRSGN